MSMIKPTVGETILAASTGGWSLVVEHWRVFLIIAAALVLTLSGFCVYKRIFNRTPKLNEPEIQAARVAIQEHNDQKLREILTNSDVREAQIDQDIYNAHAAAINSVAVSHEKYGNMNTADLAAELERRAQEP
jgi:hypothetical protein